MCQLSEHSEKTAFIKGQVKETVDQTAAGVVVRLGTMTCECGWKRAIMHMYQCLYCRQWYCFNCAEIHFGKTVKEYHNEQENKNG